MDISKEHLKNTVERLIALGEESGELHFLESIFDDLDDDEKTKLMRNLEGELEELEKAV